MKKNTLFIFITIIYTQTVFQDITAQSGTEYSYPHYLMTLGAGVTIVDINNDGFDDIISPTYIGENIKIFINTGDLNFIESAAELGVSSFEESKQVLVADYDNDGYNDLYIINFNTSSRLYKNINNQYFEDVTNSSGLNIDPISSRAGSFFDYNRDGDLDLFIINYYYEHLNTLYENNGDGTFTDISLSAGVDGNNEKNPLVVSTFDYNNDGWPDIYVGNDRNQGNYLYKNMHNGTFQNVSEESNAGIYVNSMAIATYDYENDGDIDIYVTNIDEGNKFLKNNGDGTFTEISDAIGVPVYRVCWGANFIDFNNDGLKDLYVASACDEIISVCNTPAELSNNDLLFMQNEDGTFTDYSDYSALNHNYMSYGSAMGDINNDGYSDLYVLHEFTTNILYLNQYSNIYNNNNWLKIKLDGESSNYNAIGSRIHIYVSEEQYMDEIISGTSYQSQDSYRKIFGIGTAEIIDSIAVLWPSGMSNKFFNIQSNQEILINEQDGISGCDYDCAGICGGYAVEDCNGTCNGLAVLDCMGVCDGDATSDCGCGCNQLCEDNDGDNIFDCIDDCPNIYNPYQHDRDEDGNPDACLDDDDDGDGLLDCWDYWYADGILLSDDEKNELIESGECEDFTLHNDVKPESIQLLTNYPNPFNPSTTILFNLGNSSIIDIDIYDLDGHKVQDLDEGFYHNGNHELLWTPTADISSGIYFISLKTKKSLINHKILYLK